MVKLNLLVGDDIGSYWDESNPSQSTIDIIKAFKEDTYGYISQEEFDTQGEADAYLRGFHDGYGEYPTIIPDDVATKLSVAFEEIEEQASLARQRKNKNHR